MTCLESQMSYGNIYQGVRIDIAEPLDGHPALLEILVDRWKEKRVKAPD